MNSGQLGDVIAGKLPAWVTWIARGIPAFMVPFTLWSTWRGIHRGVIRPEAVPWIVTFNAFAVCVMTYFFLKGIMAVRADRNGLSVQRLLGTRRHLPWASIERVFRDQSEGLRSVRVIPIAGAKISFTEKMSNFDALVEAIVAESGAADEGGTEKLTQPELSDRLIYAYEPRQITLDRLYVIYVQRPALHFLRLGGQLWGNYSQPEDPAAYVDPKLLERYQEIDFGEEAALSVDPTNFQMPTSNIQSVRLRSRRAIWTGVSKARNSGYLLISPTQGKPKKYILLGKQDHNSVAAILRRAGIFVEKDSPS